MAATRSQAHPAGFAGAVGLAVGAVAAGAAAGLAVERIALHRALGREDDPYRDEPFGTLRGAPHPVVADDGLTLHVEVDEPEPRSGGLGTNRRRSEARTGAAGQYGSGAGAADGGEVVTVVFCHGYALNLDSWHFQRRGLRNAARLVFWDQRSHGRSDRSEIGAATIEQTGRDLGRVIDEVAPTGPLVLVGHSMGGMTIMSLAEHRPDLFAERVAAVAFLATSAAGVTAGPPGVRGLPAKVVHLAAPAVIAALGRGARFVDGGRQLGSDLGLGLTRRYSFASDVPRSFVTWTAEMLDATPIDVVAEFFPDFDRHDRIAALSALAQVEVLVMVGRQDRVTPLRHSDAIVAALPRAELVVLDPCGHMLLLEHHDAVTDALAELIERVS